MTTPSATLRHPHEVDDAIERLRRMGVQPHPDVRAKSWDMALALETLVELVPRSGRILDMGARWSPILEALEVLGYRDIWACDLERSRREDLRRLLRHSRIRFQRADLTKTGLPAASFDAITCMSVIEHGVDVRAFLAESARLLGPNGMLLTSTDFWCAPIDTTGIFPYGPRFGQARIFTPEDLREIAAIAATYGLHLDGPMDLACAERVVTWHRTGLAYTFTYFELRRE